MSTDVLRNLMKYGRLKLRQAQIYPGTPNYIQPGLSILQALNTLITKTKILF